MISYKRSIAIMDLSRTVFERDGNFSQKFHPGVFCAPAWNWASALGVKKLELWPYRTNREV